MSCAATAACVVPAAALDAFMKLVADVTALTRADTSAPNAAVKPALVNANADTDALAELESNETAALRLVVSVISAMEY